MAGYNQIRNHATYKVHGHPVLSIKETLSAYDGLEESLDQDGYGQGLVINRFEEEMAERIGKASAVFFPSGTMAQQIALRIHCDEKSCQRVAYHPLCHLEIHEEEGLKTLHHIESVLIGDKDNLFTLKDIEALSDVAAVLFELPQREIGGLLPEWEDLVQMISLCRKKGFKTHLDGARLFEILPYYQKSAQEVCDLFDSVYLSFYKGLGGITGAMLAGSHEMMAQSKVWKRRHGGDLYRLFPYVISGQVAYKERVNKMTSYMQEAITFAENICEIQGLSIKPQVPMCNMFHVYFERNMKTMEKILSDVILKTGISLFHILRERDNRVYAELWFGDSYKEIPEEKLDAAIECFKIKYESV